MGRRRKPKLAAVRATEESAPHEEGAAAPVPRPAPKPAPGVQASWQVEPKYWRQRHRLFHRFHEGVQVDEEGWFSVTPESFARHIAERIRASLSSPPVDGAITILDAFCGCGGNAIQFALQGCRVIAVELDPVRLVLARHNAHIYGVADRISFRHDNFFALAPGPALAVDAVFLAPPWGGMDYAQTAAFDIQRDMPYPATAIFRHALRLSRNVALYMPRTTPPVQLAALAALPPCTPSLRCGEHCQRATVAAGAAAGAANDGGEHEVRGDGTGVTPGTEGTGTSLPSPPAAFPAVRIQLLTPPPLPPTIASSTAASSSLPCPPPAPVDVVSFAPTFSSTTSASFVPADAAAAPGPAPDVESALFAPDPLWGRHTCDPDLTSLGYRPWTPFLHAVRGHAAHSVFRKSVLSPVLQDRMEPLRVTELGAEVPPHILALWGKRRRRQRQAGGRPGEERGRHRAGALEEDTRETADLGVKVDEEQEEEEEEEVEEEGDDEAEGGEKDGDDNVWCIDGYRIPLSRTVRGPMQHLLRSPFDPFDGSFPSAALVGATSANTTAATAVDSASHSTAPPAVQAESVAQTAESVAQTAESVAWARALRQEVEAEHDAWVVTWREFCVRAACAGRGSAQDAVRDGAPDLHEAVTAVQRGKRKRGEGEAAESASAKTAGGAVDASSAPLPSWTQFVHAWQADDHWKSRFTALFAEFLTRKRLQASVTEALPIERVYALPAVPTTSAFSPSSSSSSTSPLLTEDTRAPSPSNPLVPSPAARCEVEALCLNGSVKGLLAYYGKLVCDAALSSPIPTP